MEPFTRIVGSVLTSIGLFLLVFYGVYMKRKEVGRGLDTPEKRMAVYAAIGIGAMFGAGGLILIVWGHFGG